MRKLQKVPAEGTGDERFRGVAFAIGIKSEAHEHFPAHAHARDVLVEPSLCALCLNKIDARVVIKVYRIRRDREIHLTFDERTPEILAHAFEQEAIRAES